MKTPRGFVAVAMVLCLASLLGGCGDDDGDDATATTATSAAGGTTTTVPSDEQQQTDGIDPMEGAGTDPVRVAATNTRTALLTAVRAARHEGYDRVVFEFRDALPGYEVAYATEPITEDGSGEPVDVDGDHAVVVRMENASGADLSTEEARPTYTGPNRFDPGTPVVAELVRAGDFEAVLTWAVGLRDRVDFRVTTLASPPRLIVDFRNH